VAWRAAHKVAWSAMWMVAQRVVAYSVVNLHLQLQHLHLLLHLHVEERARRRVAWRAA